VVEASGVMVHWLGRSGWGLSGRGHGSESKIGGHGGSGFYGGHGRICDLWPMGGGGGGGGGGTSAGRASTAGTGLPQVRSWAVGPGLPQVWPL
jgi:hypothetical protein